MSITYPDIVMPYYSKKFVISNIAPSYKELLPHMDKWFDMAKEYNINLILTDVPFCMLSKLEYYKKTDDFVYQARTKINAIEETLDRTKILPRRRKTLFKCRKCIYKNTCW
ncbi:hypothetical protein HOF65_01250 [bacterium]|jgi:hypothetical protein|nr:hypothetical protein [bacterium]MBT4633750.1 hypothetical protein [bacterium]MBT5490897.1 hypothetical protein [bacterium]MBT6778693.1 hypothetical protein [bacterium]